MTTVDELQGSRWDVIVIGTGMGGGTIGYELARLGCRVLYLEKGQSNTGAGDRVQGSYPEQAFDLTRFTEADYVDTLARGGRNTDLMANSIPDAPAQVFRPFAGSGTGGSSAIYGMVLERFFRADFTPRANVPDARESTVPESWPISYDEMVPWYRRAEQLYRVRGTADPLRPDDDTDSLIPSPPMTPANSEIADFLTGRGLHPYGLHVACEYKAGCGACESYLCPIGCKNYAGNICVDPAVRDHHAALLDRTNVVRLEANRSAVTGVVARRDGQTLRFRGKVVVLAASAVMTPVLLLNSSSDEWPAGLANQNDMVGRNLMRHLLDKFYFRTREERVTGQVKQIGVNDFYHADGHKLGTLQSVGVIPPYDLFMNVGKRERRRLAPFRWLLEKPWQKMIRERIVALATITEDLPYADNRVLPGPGSTNGSGHVATFSYAMGESDRRRNQEFVRRVGDTLGRYRNSRIWPRFAAGAASNYSLGHQCGTCRFGDDPKTSVLNRDNRAWGLDNLYVVDASMLPSSSGINPSLTIAANALRVAKVIRASV